MCRSRPGHTATFSLPPAASLASLINCTACSLADDMFMRMQWSERANPLRRGLYIHVTPHESNQHVMQKLVMQSSMWAVHRAGAKSGQPIGKQDALSKAGSHGTHGYWRHTVCPFIPPFSQSLSWPSLYISF